MPTCAFLPLSFCPTLNTCISQVNIESLRVEELDKLASSLWLMAPPCQPYTRQVGSWWRYDRYEDQGATLRHVTCQACWLALAPDRCLCPQGHQRGAQDARAGVLVCQALGVLGFGVRVFTADGTDPAVHATGSCIGLQVHMHTSPSLTRSLDPPGPPSRQLLSPARPVAAAEITSNLPFGRGGLTLVCGDAVTL